MRTDFTEFSFKPNTRNEDRKKSDDGSEWRDILTDEYQDQRERDRDDPDEQKPTDTRREFDDRHSAQIDRDTAAEKH